MTVIINFMIFIITTATAVIVALYVYCYWVTIVLLLLSLAKIICFITAIIVAWYGEKWNILSVSGERNLNWRVLKPKEKQILEKEKRGDESWRSIACSGEDKWKGDNVEEGQ